MVSPSASSHGRASINVTPLIDVLLVLLIIFMVIAPTTAQGLQTLLPHSSRGGASNREPVIIVRVQASATDQPSYSIGDRQIALGDLRQQLRSVFATREDKTIFVDGDEALDLSSVALVIDGAHDAGVLNVGILTPASGARH